VERALRDGRHDRDGAAPAELLTVMMPGRSLTAMTFEGRPSKMTSSPSL
jgi:hypothetical protein